MIEGFDYDNPESFVSREDINYYENANKLHRYRSSRFARGISQVEIACKQ